MKTRKTIGLTRLFALASVVAANMAAASPVQHTFATQLEEVRAGSFNGQDYLTVQIPGHVGPASCRGNVLKIDSNNLPASTNPQQIETVALSAMLYADEVLITIGLSQSDCVDGKPALVDLHLLDE